MRQKHYLVKKPSFVQLGLTAYSARPIVMTTIAMIAGMMPIAIGLGGDSSFRQPMAIAVIGGLISSTALSLLVVPVTFLYIDDLERRLGRAFSRFKPDL